jgi:hypothetical protein
MLIWPWIVRAFALAAAMFLFMEWQNLGVQWAAVFNWVLVMGGAEAVIHVSHRARDRRRRGRRCAGGAAQRPAARLAADPFPGVGNGPAACVSMGGTSFRSPRLMSSAVCGQPGRGIIRNRVSGTRVRPTPDRRHRGRGEQDDVDAGKIAKSHSKNKEVQQFARMITDHTAVNKRLPPSPEAEREARRERTSKSLKSAAKENVPT